MTDKSTEMANLLKQRMPDKTKQIDQTNENLKALNLDTLKGIISTSITLDNLIAFIEITEKNNTYSNEECNKLEE